MRGEVPIGFTDTDDAVIELHGNINRSKCSVSHRPISREWLADSDQEPPPSPYVKGGLARPEQGLHGIGLVGGIDIIDARAEVDIVGGGFAPGAPLERGVHGDGGGAIGRLGPAGVDGQEEEAYFAESDLVAHHPPAAVDRQSDVLGCHPGQVDTLQLAPNHIRLEEMVRDEARHGVTQLVLARRDGGVSRDQGRHHPAERLHAQAERRDVEQQNIFDIAFQNTALNGGTQRNNFIRVYTPVGLFVKNLFDAFMNCRHAGHAADQNNFIDVVG